MKTTSLAILAGMAISLSPLPVFAQTAVTATAAQVDLGINIAAELAAMKALATMDPAAAIGAFGSLVDRIGAAAAANPELAAMAADAIVGAVAQMSEALAAAGMEEAALADALASITVASTGALTQVATVAPEIAAAAMVSVANTVANVAAANFTTPQPALSAAIAAIADSLPEGTSPDVIAGISKISGAVQAGDYGSITGLDGPKSASGN